MKTCGKVAPVIFFDSKSLREERLEAGRAFEGNAASLVSAEVELLLFQMLLSVMLASDGLCSCIGKTVGTSHSGYMYKCKLLGLLK